MNVVALLCLAVVGLVCVGLDIIGFFVTVRIITLHWRIRPLLAFDRVGRPLVDPLVAAVQQAIPADWLGREPRRTKLATAATLMAVAVCRFAISSAVQFVVVPL